MSEPVIPTAASVPPTHLHAHARSMLLGVALGDALGVPVEFEPRSVRQQDPVTGMRAYGTHNQPAGTWSDDASLTFCLAEAMADGVTGEVFMNFVADNFLRWFRRNWWTAHGRKFDVGITTADSLKRVERQTYLMEIPLTEAGLRGERDNGNGALMRILPLHFYLTHTPGQEAVEFQLVRNVASITHGHIRSTAACWLYLAVARWLMDGNSPAQAYARLCQAGPAMLARQGVSKEEIDHFAPLLAGDLAAWPPERVRSSGYVLHTLEAAIWCMLVQDSFAATVLAAVNLGEDTDTTAAVAGGLAGLYYGEASFPAEWLVVLARREDIEDLAARMSSALAPSGIVPQA